MELKVKLTNYKTKHKRLLFQINVVLPRLTTCYSTTIENRHFVDIHGGPSMKSTETNYTNYSPTKTKFLNECL